PASPADLPLKMVSTFWRTLGKLPRFNKPEIRKAWICLCEALLRDMGEVTLLGILSYLKTPPGRWWVNTLLKQPDPFVSLDKWLRQDRAGSLLDKYQRSQIPQVPEEPAASAATSKKENYHARTYANRTERNAAVAQRNR